MGQFFFIGSEVFHIYTAFLWHAAGEFKLCALKASNGAKQFRNNMFQKIKEIDENDK